MDIISFSADSSRSVYRYAADAGPILAAVYCIFAASILLINRFPEIGILTLPTAISIPFVLAWLMRKLAASRPDLSGFFPLWLFGIYTSIFATLICALLSALYLIFIDPAFVATYFRNAAESLQTISSESGSADLSRQAEIIRTAIDRRLLPSPMELVAAMSWLAAFGGSVMAAVAARFRSLSKKGTKPSDASPQT